MTIKFVSENELIALFNAELRKSDQFEEGMEVFGVPEGYSGGSFSGYSFRPEAPNMAGLVSEIARGIDKNYALKTK